jgi:signal transduction histidine kinase
LLTIKNSLDNIAQRTPSAADIRGIAEAVRQAIEDVREISTDLHPHMLERLGITRTIKATIRRIAEAASLEITATVDSLDQRFTPLEEINIYRILQEALNNTVRHSHASHCSVSITTAGAYLMMDITDDGCGFDAGNSRASSGSGFGLVNMAERVRLLGGDMEIESSSGNGTSLRFKIPLERTDHKQEP